MMRSNLAHKFIFIVAIIFISLPPLLNAAEYPNVSDYYLHTKIAEIMVERQAIITPHFLYQALIIAIHSLLPFIDFKTASFLVIPILINCSLGLILYHLLEPGIESAFSAASPWRKRSLTMAIALVLMLVTPANLFNVFSYPRFYLGFTGITTYHNPTTLLVKPLTLLVFVGVIKVLSESPIRVWQTSFYLGLLTVLSLIAKPSYMICLLPAVVILLAYRLIRRIPIKWLPIIVGLGIPALLVLAFQYYYTYFTDYGAIAQASGKAGILFAPLSVISQHSKIRYQAGYTSIWFSKVHDFVVEPLDCSMFGIDYSCDVPKDFLLSILFPLIVYLVYFQQARKNLVLNFAWLTFGISAFYGYFLSESGGRAAHGNFLWSGQLCLFVLFVYTTIFLLQQADFRALLSTNLSTTLPPLPTLKLFRPLLCLAGLGLHFFSGLIYYVFILMTGLI